MLKGYEVKEKLDGGKVYVLVELEDGTTFGQIVGAVSTVAELEAAVAEAVARYAPQPKDQSEIDAIVGQYRLVRQEVP